jgi:hypothetical protein
MRHYQQPTLPCTQHQRSSLCLFGHKSLLSSSMPALTFRTRSRERSIRNLIGTGQLRRKGQVTFILCEFFEVSAPKPRCSSTMQADVEQMTWHLQCSRDHHDQNAKRISTHHPSQIFHPRTISIPGDVKSPYLKYLLRSLSLSILPYSFLYSSSWPACQRSLCAERGITERPTLAFALCSGLMSNRR